MIYKKKKIKKKTEKIRCHQYLLPVNNLIINNWGGGGGGHYPNIIYLVPVIGVEPVHYYCDYFYIGYHICLDTGPFKAHYMTSFLHTSHF